MPHRKRLSHAYVVNEEGVRELCIYYGSKEISFDEERLFPFGEQLMSQSSFTAHSATAWGPGYAWSEIRELLEVLVGEGIVKRADEIEDARGSGLVPSLLPPSQCPAPRFWSTAECESITRDLAGRAVEIGHLEAVIPAYRIVHPALDADGRQVGEANVFPAGLRLDRETDWRVCQYPGSRYRDDAPMNVTALKAMIKHWKPMMAALLAIRAEVLPRLPRSARGWTVGDLHTFSRVVLSIPAFALMRGGGRSPQPPLSPVMSSLFRITDGIRMTTHDMLFLSAERTRATGEALSAADLYGFAERNGLFLSEHGVCAGPRALMEEFFTFVFEGGVAPAELPAEVPELSSELPAAVDYGLLGLQIWAVSRTVWLEMSLAYRGLRELFAAAEPGDQPGAEACHRLRARLGRDWEELGRERIAVDREREIHREVYVDAYEQSRRALRVAVGKPTLAEQTAPVAATPAHAEAARTLHRILASRLPGVELSGARAGEPAVEAMVALLIQYLRAEQGILAAVAELQRELNVRLGRPEPQRPLEVRDFHVTFLVNPPPISATPYLFDMLADELGVRVECTATRIDITDLRAG